MADAPTSSAPSPADQSSPCARCTQPLSPGAVLCTYCGYDPRTGGVLRTHEDPPLHPTVTTCAHCGYDLSGHAIPRCPECGNYTSPSRFIHPAIKHAERAEFWICVSLAVICTLSTALGILSRIFTGTPSYLQLHHVFIPMFIFSGFITLWGAVNVWQNVNMTFSRAFIGLFVLAIIYPAASVVIFALLGISLGFLLAFFVCTTATALILRLDAMQAVIFTFFLLLIQTGLVYLLDQLHIIIL